MHIHTMCACIVAQLRAGGRDAPGNGVHGHRERVHARGMGSNQLAAGLGIKDLAVREVDIDSRGTGVSDRRCEDGRSKHELVLQTMERRLIWEVMEHGPHDRVASLIGGAEECVEVRQQSVPLPQSYLHSAHTRRMGALLPWCDQNGRRSD